MSDKIINYKGEDVLEAVHAINFGEGGILDISGEELTYDRDFREAKPCRLCDECNECTPITISGDDKYKFTNVSHGVHVLDYIKAYNLNNKHEKISVDGWSDYPVIFVMENPSINDKDGSLYNQNWGKFGKEKFMPNRWYWTVGRYDKMPKYPDYFEKKAYSGLFLSIANTFKLKNAYLTNMVKCGIGCQIQDKKGEKRETALNTGSYNPEIISNCIVERLKEEINALRREDNEKVIVFAFGDNAYYGIMRNKDKLGNVDVYELPHPVARSYNGDGNFSNDKRRDILYNIISDALEKHEITFEKEKFDKFAIFIKDWRDTVRYVEDCKCYKFYEHSIIFKYKSRENEFLEDNEARVIWIKYTFKDGGLYEVYRGTGNTSNTLVKPEDYKKYSFYEKVTEFIKELKILYN